VHRLCVVHVNDGSTDALEGIPGRGGRGHQENQQEQHVCRVTVLKTDILRSGLSGRSSKTPPRVFCLRKLMELYWQSSTRRFDTLLSAEKHPQRQIYFVESEQRQQKQQVCGKWLAGSRIRRSYVLVIARIPFRLLNIWSEYYHSLCLDYAIAEFKALI